MQTHRAKLLNLVTKFEVLLSKGHSVITIARCLSRSMKQLVSGVVACLVLVSTSQAQVNSTWNGTSGNWSDVTRWSSNPLFPNNGNGGNVYNAIVNGGTVNVNLPITIQALSLGGGWIAPLNDVIVKANFTWNAGTVTGEGVLQIHGGGTLNTNASVSNGPIRLVTA